MMVPYAATRRNLCVEVEMFGTLVESNPRPLRRRGVMMTSAALHAAVILLAGWATARGAGRSVPPPPPVVDDHTSITYLSPRNDRPPDAGTGTTAPATSPVVSLPELPSVPGIDVPAELPPADMTLGLPFSGAVADRSPAGPRRGDGGSRGTPGGVIDALRADKAALPLEGNRPPTYPSALRSAGIEGSVDVEFVIDSTGRVRPGSVVVHRFDHRAFTDAVRAALDGHRFLPAEAGGRPVAVRVRQRFAFTLER